MFAHFVQPWKSWKFSEKRVFCLFMRLCVCVVARERKKNHRKKAKQPTIIYINICYRTNRIRDMCLCRVCRTRVFFWCDNESTVSQHTSLTEPTTWKINVKSSETQTHNIEMEKKKVGKQNKRDFPTASMQTEWWIAGTRVEEMLKMPKTCEKVVTCIRAMAQQQ